MCDAGIALVDIQLALLLERREGTTNGLQFHAQEAADSGARQAQVEFDGPVATMVSNGLLPYLRAVRAAVDVLANFYIVTRPLFDALRG